MTYFPGQKMIEESEITVAIFDKRGVREVCSIWATIVHFNGRQVFHNLFSKIRCGFADNLSGLSGGDPLLDFVDLTVDVRLEVFDKCGSFDRGGPKQTSTVV